MGYKIDEIEGIGPAYREKLSAAEIKGTDDLLRLCCDAKGREAVAERTGVSEKQLLEWSNKADMMRISGVGPQFAELLEASGVDTVKELRNRNADNLAEKIQEINSKKKLAKSSPAVGQVRQWIDQAKTMDPTITH
jgi:predicted flap endonuclease-1-like 5' DNA nuclease